MYVDRVPAVRQPMPQAQSPPQAHSPPLQQNNNYGAALGGQGQQGEQDFRPYHHGQQNGYQEPQKNPYQEQAPPAAGQEPAYGKPVVAPAAAHDKSITHGHNTVAWVLFGVGFIFPLLWLVQIFMPLCRAPRFTKSNFIAWILSIIFFAIYIAAVITIIVLVGKNNNCDSYYYYCRR